MSHERQRPSSRSRQRGDHSEEYRSSSRSQPARTSSSNSSSNSGHFHSHSGNKWRAAAASAERGDIPGRVMQEEERMEDPEYVNHKLKRIQSESRDSTRRALARLNEASTMAEENLNLVNSQSEQFNRMERKLDEAHVNAKHVDAKVDHLKSLTKLFFLPSFGGKKAAKKEAEFKKQQEAKKFETKQARKTDDHWKSRNERLARNDERIDESGRSGPRNFYSTPEGLDRDDTEQEIDDNLGQISSGLSRLKMMGLQMGEEIQHQDEQLKRIDERAGFTKDKLSKLNGKVDRIARK